MGTLIDLIKEFEKRETLACKYKTDYRTFSWTYRELYEAICQTVNLLRHDFGVGAGDKVAIWGPNSPEWLIAYFAVIAAGGIVVPIDFKATRENAEKIVANAGARLAIKSRFRPAVEGGNLVLEELSHRFENYPEDTEFARVNDDDLVELVYTSGTTGDPKGVMITHKNLLSNIEAVTRHIDISAKDQMLSVLPLSHLLEQNCNMLAEFYAGASVIYLGVLKPSLIFEALKSERITIFILVPRLLMGFKHAIREKFDSPLKKRVWSILNSVAGRLTIAQRKKLFFFIHKKFGKNFRFFVSGGSNLDADTENFWSNLGFKVVQGYGLTECSPILTANKEHEIRFGSIGVPLDNVELSLSADSEIVARGPNIFKGYYQDEEKTKNAFRDGWFLTGDIGLRDTDGYYFIKGRKKDVIVTAAGVNVHPDDIEAALNIQENVKESCVIGLPTELGEEVHAVLILKDMNIDIHRLIESANRKLDSSQKIMGYTLWPEKTFPKTTTLKIKKNLVKEKIGKTDNLSITDNAYDKLLELIAIVSPVPAAVMDGRKLLARDLKIDSIGRVELASLIEQEYNIDFAEERITERTTIDDLREILASTVKHGKAISAAFWPFSRTSKLIRGFLMTFSLRVLGIWCRVESAGCAILAKQTGPVIYAPNHVSYFDQCAVLLAMPKKTRCNIATAAWAEFFWPVNKNIAIRLFKRLCYYTSAVFFAVFLLSHVKNYKKNLQFIGKLVDHGESIMMFPEGERTMTDKLLPFKAGVAALARQLKIPVTPVGISGTEIVLPRKAYWPRIARVRVSFGAPIYINDRTDQEFLQILKLKIEELRREID